MKNSTNILVLVFVFLALQSCGPKAGESKPEAATVPATQVKALTLEQKRAQWEKERIARATRLREDREQLAKSSPTYTDSKGNIVYYKAELDPMYTGGQKALADYLSKNLKFPEAARQNEAEGTVFVDFVVEKNGTVREVSVEDAYNADIDQSFRDEAYRVVAAMPKWTPGSQHGKNVDVKYSLPISFELR
jgi:TonB family protein